MGVVAMSLQSPPQRSWPIGLLLLLAVACVLYFLMLASALNQPAGGGESRMAAAFEALFLTAGLWIVLVIMIIVGGVSGAMPGWAGGSPAFSFPRPGSPLSPPSTCARETCHGPSSSPSCWRP